MNYGAFKQSVNNMNLSHLYSHMAGSLRFAPIVYVMYKTKTGLAVGDTPDSPDPFLSRPCTKVD